MANTVGIGYRLMSMVSFTVHPSVVLPVRMYSVLAAGVATGLLMVVLVNPVAGVHDQDARVLLADSCTGVFNQALSVRSTSSVGNVNRLMLMVSFTVQPSVVLPVDL